MTQGLPRIFIVDDEAPARARLKTLLSDIAADYPHELIGEAAQAQQALDSIDELAPDVVLLDVQMPGMSGIELAAHLAQRDMQKDRAAPAIIFVTAYDEYALKAFEVHALDYLLKPVRASRLAEALRHAGAIRGKAPSQRETIAGVTSALNAPRRNFSVQERGRLLLVPVAEVLYLKAEAKYITLRTREREYLLEASLQSLEQEFTATFIRVHRNALVARDAILGVERGTVAIDAEGENEKGQESWQVILRGIDDRLPISRRQWPAVKVLVR